MATMRDRIWRRVVRKWLLDCTTLKCHSKVLDCMTSLNSYISRISRYLSDYIIVLEMSSWYSRLNSYSKSNYHCGSFNVVAVPNNAKEQKEAKRELRLEKSKNARDLSRRCRQRFHQTIAERERKEAGAT